MVNISGLWSLRKNCNHYNNYMIKEITMKKYNQIMCLPETEVDYPPGYIRSSNLLYTVYQDVFYECDEEGMNTLETLKQRLVKLNNIG